MDVVFFASGSPRDIVAAYTRHTGLPILPPRWTAAPMHWRTYLRIWDALDPAYRLSVSYIARLVRLDPDAQQHTRPAVATRFAYGDEARA